LKWLAFAYGREVYKKGEKTVHNRGTVDEEKRKLTYRWTSFTELLAKGKKSKYRAFYRTACEARHK